ncbi:flagellar basal body rod protein FlgC [Chitinimonas sp. BJB300]|uniref:flagellar basal body rod protein FlgC n=1 Tax=Chitinimonas sp. BJB300 TaxID=1559339 RepID=UPI000C116198|nr:flagellar basal body rod protein FlgC [Chitinimonas sp. BJB300]PHV12877.1 flagellar basal body rod protein FlgC [Chitinimonas sp. BJB300]TSJ86091.1 flagellar basal body rod protein FlgC [Chitinimonas sp. BJB300]
MDYRSAFAISAAGMSVEKLRLDVTALNLANMNSTQGADGQLFKPMRVVATLGGANFASQFEASASSLTSLLPAGRIEAMDVAPRVVHDPGHPDADEQGRVKLPGVNHLGEMVNMMSALRAYEANVVALNAAKTMAQRALDIGGAA